MDDPNKRFSRNLLSDSLSPCVLSHTQGENNSVQKKIIIRNTTYLVIYDEQHPIVHQLLRPIEYEK